MLMLIFSYQAVNASIDAEIPLVGQWLAMEYHKELGVLSQPTFQQLQSYIDKVRFLMDELAQTIQIIVASKEQYTISVVSDSGLSTVVAGSKDAPLASILVDAIKSPSDGIITYISLLLKAPENNSQKGLSHCQLWDGESSLNVGVNPLPSKKDNVSVIFPFTKPLFVAKGTSKMLILTCDVIKDPQGPATYAWWLSESTSSAKTLLISSGSFVLEVASTTPAARGVKSGSKEEIAAVFELYAAGEAVELKELAMQINGNPWAVTAYSLWDSETQVGGGKTSGDSVFKAVVTKPFVIPKDAHKLLTIKVDIAPATEAGRVQTGDTFAVNYNGGDNNFVLTYGMGSSSGRGINPSIKTDTNTPEITLTGN